MNIIKYKNKVLTFKGVYKNVSIINLYAPTKQTRPFMNIDLLKDGVHFNNKGNNKLFSYLLQTFIGVQKIKDMQESNVEFEKVDIIDKKISDNHARLLLLLKDKMIKVRKMIKTKKNKI